MKEKQTWRKFDALFLYLSVPWTFMVARDMSSLHCQRKKSWKVLCWQVARRCSWQAPNETWKYHPLFFLWKLCKCKTEKKVGQKWFKNERKLSQNWVETESNPFNLRQIKTWVKNETKESRKCSWNLKILSIFYKNTSSKYTHEIGQLKTWK